MQPDINPLQLHRALINYLLKFIGSFCLLYFGCLVVDDLSNPSNHYSAFVDHYLNFINPLVRLILFASKAFLSLLGYSCYFKDSYTLSFLNGHGVTMASGCAGFGVISFWIAFVFANKGSWQKKTFWIATGCFAICAINTLRISFLLLSNEKKWTLFFGMEHHRWFNIVSYGFIFGLILLFMLLESKSTKRKLQEQQKVRNNYSTNN